MAEFLAAPPVLLPGESAAEFAALRESMAAAVRPRDVFEAVWARDIADLTWEVFRWRRLKARFLARIAARRLGAAMADPHAPMSLGAPASPPPGREHALPYGHRPLRITPEDFAALAPELAAAGGDPDAVAAESACERVHYVEYFEALTAAAEARRNAMLREVSRHRVVFAAALRRAAVAVEARVQW